MNHEAVCEQCGRCCLIKTAQGMTGERCAYQNPVTLRCSIYKHRHKMKGQAYSCATHKQAIAQRLYPNDCPYVKNIADYKTEIPYPTK